MWKVIRESGIPDKLLMLYPVWIHCSVNDGYMDYLVWDGFTKCWRYQTNSVFDENEKIYVESYFVILSYK